MPLTDLFLKTEFAVSKEQWKGHSKQNASPRGCEDHTQMISVSGCQLQGCEDKLGFEFQIKLAVGRRDLDLK